MRAHTHAQDETRKKSTHKFRRQKKEAQKY